MKYSSYKDDKRTTVLLVLTLVSLVVVGLVALFGQVAARAYTLAFAKEAAGELLKVEKSVPDSYYRRNPRAAFSAEIALRTSDGAYVAFPSTDHQWIGAKKGRCVEARLYPFAPWEFARASGVYRDSRFLKFIDCRRL